MKHEYVLYSFSVCVHSHLKAVVEEEESDMFSTVTWLVSQGDRFYSVNQTAMGWQQVGLQRKQYLILDLCWLHLSYYHELLYWSNIFSYNWPSCLLKLEQDLRSLWQNEVNMYLCGQIFNYEQTQSI